MDTTAIGVYGLYIIHEPFGGANGIIIMTSMKAQRSIYQYPMFVEKPKPTPGSNVLNQTHVTGFGQPGISANHRDR